MLESHIIQARARAAATESQAYERMTERMGDVNDHHGLLTGEMETLQYACMILFLKMSCDCVLYFISMYLF